MISHMYLEVTRRLQYAVLIPSNVVYDVRVAYDLSHKNRWKDKLVLVQNAESAAELIFYQCAAQY